MVASLYIKIINNSTNYGTTLPIKKCLAFGTQCTNCKRYNHFDKMCRQPQQKLFRHLLLHQVIFLVLMILILDLEDFLILALVSLIQHLLVLRLQIVYLCTIQLLDSMNMYLHSW